MLDELCSYFPALQYVILLSIPLLFFFFVQMLIIVLSLGFEFFTLDFILDSLVQPDVKISYVISDDSCGRSLGLIYW